MSGNTLTNTDTIYHLREWDGQICSYGKDGEYLPNKIKFNQIEREINSEEIGHFSVNGWTWDFEFNTGFQFNKLFSERDKAEIFFYKIKERYPKSIVFLEETRKLIIKQIF